MNRYRQVLASFKIADATISPAGGRSLTIPNQSVKISDAVTRYSAPTIAEKLKGYYEEEGIELPNFDRLDRVERLQLLADAKATMTSAALRNRKAAKEAADKAAADKAAADAAAAASNPIPGDSKSDSK